MKRVRFVAPALGSRFAAAVEEATARAVAFPDSGSPAPASTRRVFVEAFPFSVVYREDEEGIAVLALAHHSRRPEYWKYRTRGS